MKKSKLQLVYLEDRDSDATEQGLSYQRVSTPGQEDGTSLFLQRQANLAGAAILNVMVQPHRIIDEVWSGADPERPGYQTAWNMIVNGEVQHVFIYDTDRLARDPWHVLQFIRHCKDHGVILHFADGTTVESILDEAMQYLKGFVGHQEREKTAMRTLNGKYETARANRMPNGCGRGLYGYDYDRITQTKPKPRWDVRFAGGGEGAGSLAVALQPLIAGRCGSGV